MPKIERIVSPLQAQAEALRAQLDEIGRELKSYKFRCDEYPAVSADLLQGMDPVKPRPRGHVAVMPSSEIVKQIERDIDSNYGRKADLLFEFVGALEIAVVAALNLKDEHVDEWLREEVDRLRGVSPLSDDDRNFLRRYLRNLIIDEGVRRRRRKDGMESLRRFHGEVGLQNEADQLQGRELELLQEYAGDFTDNAQGAAVKNEYLDGYVRDEVALWPGVLELSEEDSEWLRQWLMKMILAEYERIRIKQSKD